ncbi:PREDICTED: uncharacterized protein K02A2.6-like, partial [Vollenhovia emeryi]|uniref:uncharacterized protein K02A2.6-like n=1 Tax=Vollenhovia emeryi TaxID=411798 RepID=UPI0005F547CA
MALIGSIEAFNPRETDITSYMERIEMLFACNEVVADKKVSLLLTLIGGEAYGVLKDLLAPTLPSTLAFERLRTELENHYSPRRLVIAERYKFYSAAQESNEDIKSYVARLKNLAKHCAFGTFLNEALRDKLVCGIRSENIQRKLLTEDNLTYERAFQIATSMEMAEGQIKVMGTDATSVNKVSVSKYSRSKKAGQSSSQNRATSSQPGQASRADHPSSSTGKTKCGRCFRVHWDNNKCPAINWKCFSCNQKGHTAKSALCKNKINEVAAEEASQEEPDTDVNNPSELGWLRESGEMYFLNTLWRCKGNESLRIQLPVENKVIIMEVDSGACKSVIHINDYKKWYPKIRVEPVTFQLRVVTGEQVNIVGQISVSVRYQKKVFALPLVILDSKSRFTPLLGRNWLNILNPHWKQVVDTKMSVEQCKLSSIGTQESDIVKGLLGEIKSKFQRIFDEEPNSVIQHFKAEIKLKDNAKPIFHRAYSMPYAVKSRVEEEVTRMVQSGILTKVAHSRWASPIVVVPKKNNSDIRICVDFKKTLNRVIDRDHCVLPLPEDIFACLGGSKFFSVIDLQGAYHQLQIGNDTRELFTINTHMGLFRYNRLTYGVSSAPGIFQSCMEMILAGIPQVKCYLDDILIYGSSLLECHKNGLAVLERLYQYNVKVNKTK